jgi:hypothetical protein
LGGACALDLGGACTPELDRVMPELIEALCFLVLLVAAAALDGTIMGIAAVLTANRASVSSRIANLFMHFSCGLMEESPEV